MRVSLASYFVCLPGNSLSREPLETALPEHDDPTELANEFGTFFLKKIEIVKENLDKFQV